VEDRPQPSQASSRGDESDQTLLDRFRSGESDAATAIYLRYAKRLQLLARAQLGGDLSVRLDPEDVVQSVFRTFFRRAAEGHYQLPEGDELWKLFLVISLNKIRTLGQYHRAAKRNVENTAALEKIEPFMEGSDPDAEAYRVLRMTIDDLLGGLPEIQQRMVVLRIEGQNVGEIADRTKRSKRSVERLLQDFRQRLRSSLDER
jgi:RNA polymerase sigma-70 factor, ECF subfamily